MGFRRFDNGPAAFAAQPPICNHTIKSDPFYLSNRILGRNAGRDFITCMFQYYSL